MPNIQELIDHLERLRDAGIEGSLCEVVAIPGGKLYRVTVVEEADNE